MPLALWCTGTSETFVQRVGNSRDLESVVHVVLDVLADPSDREMGNLLNPLYDLPSFLAATEQPEARRPIA